MDKQGQYTRLRGHGLRRLGEAAEVSLTPTTAGTNRIKVCTSCQHGALPSGSNLDRAVYTPTHGIPQPRRPPSPLPAHHVLASPCLPRARRLQFMARPSQIALATSRHFGVRSPRKRCARHQQSGAREGVDGHWTAAASQQVSPRPPGHVLRPHRSVPSVSRKERLTSAGVARWFFSQ